MDQGRRGRGERRGAHLSELALPAEDADVPALRAFLVDCQTAMDAAQEALSSRYELDAQRVQLLLGVLRSAQRVSQLSRRVLGRRAGAGSRHL